MERTMFRELRTSFILLLVFTLLTGVAYPLIMTGAAQVVCPDRASGSLIVRNGKVLGSELIGQPFDDPKYFWGRPSATGPFPYNAASSTGSNLAVSNPAQVDAIRGRIETLRESGIPTEVTIPADLVTASGSGLDPHISVTAAKIQIPRIARVRGISEAAIENLVERRTEVRQFGIFGEPRVNVLLLNLMLDDSSPEKRTDG